MSIELSSNFKNIHAHQNKPTLIIRNKKGRLKDFRRPLYDTQFT